MISLSRELHALLRTPQLYYYLLRSTRRSPPPHEAAQALHQRPKSLRTLDIAAEPTGELSLLGRLLVAFVEQNDSGPIAGVADGSTCEERGRAKSVRLKDRRKPHELTDGLVDGAEGEVLVCPYEKRGQPCERM